MVRQRLTALPDTPAVLWWENLRFKTDALEKLLVVLAIIAFLPEISNDLLSLHWLLAEALDSFVSFALRLNYVEQVLALGNSRSIFDHTTPVTIDHFLSKEGRATMLQVLSAGTVTHLGVESLTHTLITLEYNATFRLTLIIKTRLGLLIDAAFFCLNTSPELIELVVTLILLLLIIICAVSSCILA